MSVNMVLCLRSEGAVGCCCAFDVWRASVRVHFACKQRRLTKVWPGVTRVTRSTAAARSGSAGQHPDDGGIAYCSMFRFRSRPPFLPLHFLCIWNNTPHPNNAKIPRNRAKFCTETTPTARNRVPETFLRVPGQAAAGSRRTGLRGRFYFKLRSKRLRLSGPGFRGAAST